MLVTDGRPVRYEISSGWLTGVDELTLTLQIDASTLDAVERIA